MKEIGSEFWNVPTTQFDNGLFSDKTKWFQSGRSALMAIITENNFKTVALPNWCCESMVQPFISYGISVKYYSLGNPISADATLIMDYFGYVCEQDTSNLSGVVIRDTTHSIFSKNYDDADYYFGSLRKWAGFYTGGYVEGLKTNNLYESNDEFVLLRESAMNNKQKYIDGLSNDKYYLKQFAAAEKMLDYNKIYGANKRDIILAKRMDVDFIKQRRQQNARAIIDAFPDITIFKTFNENECPMFVPILVPNKKRDALRRHLIDNNVFCPIHWPNSGWENIEDELSLVCDQRYTISDIQKEIDLVKSFLRE